jgi:hypothetical protein
MSISSTVPSQRRPHIMDRKNFRLLVAEPQFNVPSPPWYDQRFILSFAADCSGRSQLYLFYNSIHYSSNLNLYIAEFQLVRCILFYYISNTTSVWHFSNPTGQYSLPLGVFLFVGYSRADEKAIYQFTHTNVSRSLVTGLDRLMYISLPEMVSNLRWRHAIVHYIRHRQHTAQYLASVFS